MVDRDEWKSCRDVKRPTLKLLSVWQWFYQELKCKYSWFKALHFVLHSLLTFHPSQFWHCVLRDHNSTVPVQGHAAISSHVRRDD